MNTFKHGWLAGILLIAAGFISAYQQPSKNINAESIQYMGSLEEALAAQKDHPKKIIVDLYTDWCNWCKVMDKNTFSEPSVYNYINDKFYFVRINGEADKNIQYQGKTYSLQVVNGKKMHQFSSAFGSVNGRVGYPTFIFFDEKGNKIEASQGFKDTEAFNKILKFYGENIYLKSDWNTYINN